MTSKCHWTDHYQFQKNYKVKALFESKEEMINALESNLIALGKTYKGYKIENIGKQTIKQWKEQLNIPMEQKTAYELKALKYLLSLGYKIKTPQQ